MFHREDSAMREQFLRSPEGHVFVLGSLALILWICLIIVLWRLQYPLWNDLLIMGFTALTVGRVAGIAYASSADVPRLLMTFLAIYLDMVTVFIIYPILIFSYEHLFHSLFFQKRVSPIFESARKGLRRLARFQIAGLFIFVWSPFWMTGVIVGAVLGYLMGLKTWVIMATVAAGTTTAIICWVYANDVFFGWLSGMAPWVPKTVALVVILGLIVARMIMVRRARRHAAQPYLPSLEA